MRGRVPIPALDHWIILDAERAAQTVATPFNPVLPLLCQ